MTATTILGDWGTTRLRLFRHGPDGAIERLAGAGIGQLVASPAETLVGTLAPWREAGNIDRVLLCGMAGSRNGLIEVPYAKAPAGIDDWADAAASLTVDGMQVTVAAGLSSANFAGRPDVMRGEEAQLFGALALDPALASGRHLIVLPGTHSKWTELVDGRITRFHTFPTGEMFALLSNHSTLTRAGTDTDGREQGFADGISRAGRGVLASLFETRAAQLIDRRSHGWALGFLSGVLIGSEVAEALALLDHAPDGIALIGDPGLSRIYLQAGAAHGLSLTTLDGDTCAIAGLDRLARHLSEKTA
jgi:2-dehydro-3-deoxygalactonokinase